MPTRQAKHDARSSSGSVLRHQEGGTSRAGTGASASSEKCKDEQVGWLPNLKGDNAKFLYHVIFDHLSLQGTLSTLIRL